jgi:hypothetical protein
VRGASFPLTKTDGTMPEVEWGEGPETVDVCVEDFADLRHPGGPPVGILLALLAEGIALVVMGTWALAFR